MKIVLPKFRRSLAMQQLRYFSFQLNEKQINSYNENGYLVVEQMISKAEIEQIKKRTRQIIDENEPDKNTSEFRTNSNRGADFINSGDKIQLFLEPGVTNEDGTFKYPHHLCYNKMGHAMHDLDPVFEKFCYQQKFKSVLIGLSYNKPTLVQTMYIFKNPKIGQKVDVHTDNTYLISEPKLSTIAIWIALDDATQQNGCLWGVKGSHNLQTTSFFRCNPDRTSTYTEGTPKPMDITDSQSLEVKAGDAIIFSGDFVHFSKDNLSDKQRHAFTMHFVELQNNRWSQSNWLQRPNLPFRDYLSHL